MRIRLLEVMEVGEATATEVTQAPANVPDRAFAFLALRKRAVAVGCRYAGPPARGELVVLRSATVCPLCHVANAERRLAPAIPVRESGLRLRRVRGRELACPVLHKRAATVVCRRAMPAAHGDPVASRCAAGHPAWHAVNADLRLAPATPVPGCGLLFRHATARARVNLEQRRRAAVVACKRAGHPARGAAVAIRCAVVRLPRRVVTVECRFAPATATRERGPREYAWGKGDAGPEQRKHVAAAESKRVTVTASGVLAEGRRAAARPPWRAVTAEPLLVPAIQVRELGRRLPCAWDRAPVRPALSRHAEPVASRCAAETVNGAPVATRCVTARRPCHVVTAGLPLARATRIRECGRCQELVQGRDVLRIRCRIVGRQAALRSVEEIASGHPVLVAVATLKRVIVVVVLKLVSVITEIGVIGQHVRMVHCHVPIIVEYQEY